jgi:hypothetical protein
MIAVAASLNLLLTISIIACIFCPLGMVVGAAQPGAYLVGIVSYATKIVAAAFLLGVFGLSITKMRAFRVPEFVGAALMFGLLATRLLFVSRGL